jgi:hypothetical protein
MSAQSAITRLSIVSSPLLKSRSVQASVAVTATINLGILMRLLIGAGTFDQKTISAM